MEKIASESRFFLRLLISLIKTPFVLVLMLFGRRSFSELCQPFTEFRDFVGESKATTSLIMINISIFLVVTLLAFFGIFTQDTLMQFFTSRPNDLFSLNVIPIIGSWFMHANLLHLFGNMLFLFILGRVVERGFGPGKTLIIYFGSAFISTAVNAIVSLWVLGTDVPGLGASGAIAGLASAAMLISPLYITYMAFGIPLPIFVVSWSFLVSDLIGVIRPVQGDNVGHLAHLGGFFAMAVLVFLFSRNEKRRMIKGLIFNAATAAILIALRYLI